MSISRFGDIESRQIHRRFSLRALRLYEERLQFWNSEGVAMA